jgi:phospholipid-translocating ATPase
MFRDSRPIALRKLMPFSNRKHRTSDSIHSDEDPLLDEEAAVMHTRNKFEKK